MKRLSFVTGSFLAMVGLAGLVSGQADRKNAERRPVAAIDHVILAAADLDAASAEVEKRTGVKPVFGGNHPNRGTQNALLSLGTATYLEILAPQREAGADPTAAQLKRLQRLTPYGWAVLVLDEAETRKRLTTAGFELTESRPGSRVTPSGAELKWIVFGLKNSFPGAPFFIQWAGGTSHPAETSPKGCTLANLNIATPEAKKLQAVVEALDLRAGVTQAAQAGMRFTLDCRTLVTFE